MDVERTMLSSALSGDGVLTLVSKGVTPELFSGTPAGQQCASVFRFSIEYTRYYGQQPSLSAVQRAFPGWQVEFSPDPLEALADEFLDAVRKRYFDAAVVRLSREFNGREHWRRLDEVMLDSARELASILPSGGVARFAADMERRTQEYEVEKNQGVRPTIPMGVPVFDDVTGGLRTGWLVTIAGFSGLGKSTLGQILSLSAFENDQPALFLSLEMTRQEVLERMDTMVNHFQHKDLVRRQLDEAQIERWQNIARVYSKARGEIVVVDKLGGCTVDRIEAEIQRYRPSVVVVDYVQRMTGTRHSMSRAEGLEEVTNGLKSIAMNTDSAILMVSQDGRQAAEEGSTRTSGFGSISVYTAADLYLGMMQTDEMRGLGKMRLKMLKFRHGDWGAEVDMKWNPSIGEFVLWTDPMQFNKNAIGGAA